MDDMNLVQLVQEFADEKKSRAYLEGLRWPEGVACPRCKSAKVYRVLDRDQFDCNSCRYQFSVTAGTIFHDSHLPLWKWFLAVYVMGESKKGVSANQLKRMLGTSYKTAWYLCHRVRAAMRDDMSELLSGIIEADETHHGGRYGGVFSRKPSLEGKATILGAVERGGRLRM